MPQLLYYDIVRNAYAESHPHFIAMHLNRDVIRLGGNRGTLSKCEYLCTVLRFMLYTGISDAN